MRLIFSFDTSALVSFDKEKGELEIDTERYLYTPPYLSSQKELASGVYTEAKGYHIRVGETGIRLIPYGSKT